MSIWSGLHFFCERQQTIFNILKNAYFSMFMPGSLRSSRGITNGSKQHDSSQLPAGSSDYISQHLIETSQSCFFYDSSQRNYSYFETILDNPCIHLLESLRVSFNCIKCCLTALALIHQAPCPPASIFSYSLDQCLVCRVFTLKVLASFWYGNQRHPWRQSHTAISNDIVGNARWYTFVSFLKLTKA